MEGMEVIDSTLLDEVISAMDAYDYDKYTDKDVENALSHDVLTTEDFAALLSPAPFATKFWTLRILRAVCWFCWSRQLQAHWKNATALRQTPASPMKDYVRWDAGAALL